MEPLYSVNEARKMDSTLISSSSLDEEKLIDNAARMALEEAIGYVSGKKVVFLVGKGNNGSDALTMAALSLGIAESVSVLCLFQDGNPSNKARRKRLAPSLFVTALPPSFDTVVDGVFGFSYHADVDERIRAVFDAVAVSGAKVVALDIPSAFLIRADLTVTFMAGKKELYDPSLRHLSGRIVTRNPGFDRASFLPSSSFLLSSSDYSVPPLPPTAYKKVRGHLAVAGGSRRYPGAPVLSSLAAFHAGCGLVTLLSEEYVRNLTVMGHPSIMVRGKEDMWSVDAGAYVAGPGWDDGERTVLEEIRDSGRPVVVDASAIKLLGGMRFGWRAVVTPHMGEFRTLRSILSISEEDDIFSALRTASRKLEAVVVLKSAVTLISDGSVTYVHDGMEPSLGVAGSGDVLAGVIGAFLAYGLSPMESAVNGVLLHGRAGHRLGEKLGFYTAEDLISEIGRER